jgi:zona occludens toxin
MALKLLFIERIAEHRKRGIDIITIWQSPHDQMDTFLRGLVGMHVHLERKFNTQFVNWYEWAKYQPKPLEYFAKQEAITKKVKLDKNYFDAYTSAVLHTHKARLPWKKLALCAVGLSVFVYGGAMAYDAIGRMKAKTELVPVADLSAPSLTNPPAGIGSRNSSRDRAPMTAEQYLDSYIPRITDFPHTAPRYDELMVPVTAPKIAACIFFIERDLCSCSTQQATPIDVSRQLCMQVVSHGWFDDTTNPNHSKKSRFLNKNTAGRGRGRSTSDSDALATSL